MIMRPVVWIASCVALCAGFLAPVGSVRGQRPAREAEEVGYLQAPELKTADRSRFSDLYHGREPLRESDRPLLQKAAEYYVNRLTDPRFRKGTVDAEGFGPQSDGRTRMTDLVRDIKLLVPAYDPKKWQDMPASQKQFIQVFSRYLEKQLEKVLETPYPITHINAAMILDHLARAGYEEVSDSLIKLMQDPKENDGTRLYAVRGIRDLFALQYLQPPVPIKDKEREARCIDALIKFLNRPPDQLGKDPSDAEIDGFRWVRREAVIALGLTRHPWMQDANGKPVGGPVAWHLLRVACKNDFNPEPSLKEQVEAALGVCQLKARDTPDYHIDYAAYYLGWFLRDFTMQYVADRDKKTQAWKYLAVRLTQALLALQEDANANRRDDREAAEYVKVIVAQFEPVLRSIEGQSVPDTANLRGWLEQHPPKGKTSLFGNDPKYQLKPPRDSGT